MASKILPIDKVVERTGLSRRLVYAEISEQRFPRPIQLTARRVGWPENDIDAWIAEKVATRDGVAV